MILGVECGDSNSKVQADAALRVPCCRSEKQGLLFDLTSDEFPQAGTIILGVRLGTKDLNSGSWIGSHDGLCRGHPGYTAAYNVISHLSFNLLEHVLPYAAFWANPIIG